MFSIVNDYKLYTAMAFFRQLFTVLLCFVMLSVFLQYVQGLPKPKSWTRTKEEKKMYKRIPIIKASLGATCKLRCSFRSKSSNVQWFLNNKLLSRTNKDYRFKRRHSKELLVISKVTKDHSGIYSCIVAGKRRVACRIIVTSDKKAKCRRKRSTDADDICKKPPKMRIHNPCQRFNFSKCDSFAGDPENVKVFDFIHEKKLTIQIQWNTPRQGFSDLWGFQGQLIGLQNDANNVKCHLITSKITTHMSFIKKLVYGAEYKAILRSLPSNNPIIITHPTKERCQYDEFKHLHECCTIVNLNGTVLDEEGKIELSWNYKCANNTTVVNKFLVRWTNLQMTHHPAKCLNISKTSEMNYTIDLPSECRRYNYSIRVYILDESDNPIDKCTKITVHYPVNPPYPENTEQQESGPNTKIIAAVIGIIAGTALVMMFFIYKYFFTKVWFKLPLTPPPEYRYEQQEGNEGALLQRKVSSSSESDNQSMLSDCEGTQPYLFEPYDSQASSGRDSANESDEEQQFQLHERLQNTDWCTCENCQRLDRVEECICCSEIERVVAKNHEAVEVEGLNERPQCITQHPGFHAVCLNRWVLQTAWFQYKQQYSDAYEGPDHKKNRHIAYRQLARWCWGVLGKEVRVVLPSCAVCCIRAHFPPPGLEDDFVFEGFKFPDE